jgi:hypothetical protein
MAVLLILLQLVVPGSPAAAAGFPANATGAAPSVAINLGDSPTRTLIIPKNPRTAVYSIPLQFSSIPTGTSYMREAERYTLTAADGYSWTSEWIIAYGFTSPTDAGGFMARSGAMIDIPWGVHDRFMGAPVSLRMEFLMDRMDDVAPVTYTLTTAEQTIPGAGTCALDQNSEDLTCRTLFTQRQFFNVRTFRNTAPCEAQEQVSATPTTLPPGRVVLASGALGVVGRAAILFPVLSPIRLQRVYLMSHREDPSGHLCPGVPITFAGKIFNGRVQLETPNATIVLKDVPGRVGP